MLKFTSNLDFAIRRFPFDAKSPLGFSIALTFQFTILSYAVVIAGCVIALAIGSYSYGVVLSKALKVSLNSINRHVRRKKNEICILDEIIEFVQFHSRGKQLSKKLSGALIFHHS